MNISAKSFFLMSTGFSRYCPFKVALLKFQSTGFHLPQIFLYSTVYIAPVSLEPPEFSSDVHVHEVARKKNMYSQRWNLPIFIGPFSHRSVCPYTVCRSLHCYRMEQWTTYTGLTWPNLVYM
jgi:hypothetical protein